MTRSGAIVAGVTVAGLLGLLAWAWRSGAALQAWALASQSVLVPERLRPTLDRLAAAVPDVPWIVTSGTRSPAQQAAAMGSKIERGENLYDLYAQDDLVSEILAVIGSTTAPDVAAMTAVIEAQVARGAYISRHLREDALDFRTRGLTDDQVDRMVAAVRAEGGQALVESDHLHVEELPA